MRVTGYLKSWQWKGQGYAYVNESMLRVFVHQSDVSKASVLANLKLGDVLEFNVELSPLHATPRARRIKILKRAEGTVDRPQCPVCHHPFNNDARTETGLTGHAKKRIEVSKANERGTEHE
jgi:hypothetical protein